MAVLKYSTKSYPSLYPLIKPWVNPLSYSLVPMRVWSRTAHRPISSPKKT